MSQMAIKAVLRGRLEGAKTEALHAKCADKADYRGHSTISVKFPDGSCQQIEKLDFFAGRHNLKRYMV